MHGQQNIKISSL